MTDDTASATDEGPRWRCDWVPDELNPGPECPYCAGDMCARMDNLNCRHNRIERHGYPAATGSAADALRHRLAREFTYTGPHDYRQARALVDNIVDDWLATLAAEERAERAKAAIARLRDDPELVALLSKEPTE